MIMKKTMKKTMTRKRTMKKTMKRMILIKKTMKRMILLKILWKTLRREVKIKGRMRRTSPGESSWLVKARIYFS